MKSTIKQISSIENPKLQLVKSLHSGKKRHKEKLFLVEGLRLSEMAAISMDWNIIFVITTEKFLASRRGLLLVERLYEQKNSIYCVSEELFCKISEHKSPQGIILVMEQRNMSLMNTTISDMSLWIIADRIQDPGNLGSIIRTAEGIGCSGIVLLKGCVDVYSEKVIRSTMGAVFNVPIYTNVSENDFFSFTEKNSIIITATSLSENAIPLYYYNFNKSIALVLGNEANGISSKILSQSQKIYIPMQGKSESLNVSSAAAIVIYEIYRQRLFSSKHT